MKVRNQVAVARTVIYFCVACALELVLWSLDVHWLCLILPPVLAVAGGLVEGAYCVYVSETERMALEQQQRIRRELDELEMTRPRSRKKEKPPPKEYDNSHYEGLKDKLGALAMSFRSSKDEADRQRIACEYRGIASELMLASQWYGVPPEDQLPDEYMPCGEGEGE